MKEIIKLGLILMIIALIASSLLALTYEGTIEKITAQREMQNEEARKQVFPEADGFEKIADDKLSKMTETDDKIKEVFMAKKAGETVGYVYKTAPTGFGGAVEVITGIDLDGTITGVRIGNHQETPGLGTNAALPYFYEQYGSMSIKQEIGVSKIAKSDSEILAITGATITSRAVTSGVNLGKIVLENMSN